ncbi:MAG: exodeoxyribonuclease VII large subunit [Candidatus Moraniibacteriota bacterium]
MNYELLQQLKQWRDEQARIEGVETYRVMNNATLEALIARRPSTLAELLEVKGIKEAKSRRYGKALLQMLQAQASSGDAGGDAETGEVRGVESREQVAESVGPEALPSAVEAPLTVSQFLDSLNLELSGMAARLCGEVSEFNIWNNSFVFFSLKDSQDGSVLKCGMPYARYQVCGVDVKVGDEVIVEGFPKMYKPRGELSLQVGVIEYAGEGELKKAYDALHKKLELVGAFSLERKRPIPEFAEKIALITSEQGAAIGDFTMNLARAGIHVDFYPTLVEGKKAVFDIIEAIRYFNQTPDRYDVLVLIRGGGSLESLQAFNTEALVQEIVSSRIPVLAGIGHERDVSLAALVADHMVSTPTAAARYLSISWDEARARLEIYSSALSRVMQEFRMLVRERVRVGEESIRRALSDIVERVGMAQAAFREAVALFPAYCHRVTLRLGTDAALWQAKTDAAVLNTRDQVKALEARLRQYDPARALQLGYSLVRREGRIIRDAARVAVGDRIDIQLGQGSIESEVIGIT